MVTRRSSTLSLQLVCFLLVGIILISILEIDASRSQRKPKHPSQPHRSNHNQKFFKDEGKDFQRWRLGPKQGDFRNRKGQDWIEKEPYDYIIIGAGSAGSVLANRLSAEQYKHSVLVIEAGPPDSTLNRAISDPFEMGNVRCFSKFFPLSFRLLFLAKKC